MTNITTQYKIDQTYPIQMTPEAITHLKKQIQKRGTGIGMCLKLEKSGCSGYSYVMEIIDESKPEDKLFPLEDNLILTIPLQDYPFLRGTVIDFVKQGLNAHFSFNNPNEKHACGCGESVGF